MSIFETVVDPDLAVAEEEEFVACVACLALGEECDAMDGDDLRAFTINYNELAGEERGLQHMLKYHGVSTVEEYQKRYEDAGYSEADIKNIMDMFWHDVKNRAGRVINVKRDVEVCINHWSSCEWCDEAYIPWRREIFASAEAIYAAYWSLYEPNFADRLCPDCAEGAYMCDDCGEPTSEDDQVTVNYEYTYCTSCADDCRWCDSCEMHFTSSGDCDCESTRGNSRIMSYTYRPRAQFGWILETDGDLSTVTARSRVPFMGFELEIEITDGNLSEILDTLDQSFAGRAYYKHDGSLSNGFEIVTHPMTLAAHKELIDWSFAEKLVRLGARSFRTETCGLHVHVSRSAFRTATHLALFQHMFTKNQSEMERLAGRSATSWARFSTMQGNIVKSIKGQVYRDRYEAVNVTNSNTIEVRIFRGSIKRERILMALGLVDAVFHYTALLHSGALRNGGISFSEFSGWVRKQEGKYDELIQYLDKFSL